MEPIPDILTEYGYWIKNDKKTVDVIRRAKEFRKKYIDPVAYEIDKRSLIEPHYFSEDLVKKGCEYGFISLPVPGFIGGGGGTILQCALLLEELCAGCAGIANIFGAHYLGLSPILLSVDLNLCDRFLYELVEKEKQGEAVLFSAAITEPMAGTDVEEAEFLPKARLVTSAKKVEGGYVLNGSKVFISNGNEAKYNVVICAIDKKKPVETWSVFVVPASSKGFSVGRVELKMGQRASHAAELIFEDCFVPEKNRVGVEGMGARGTEIVLAASRAPVAAIATGIARGAYEKALEYSRKKRTLHGKLIDKQWVQLALADMVSMIVSARHLYVNAASAFDERILSPLYGNKRLTEPVLKMFNPLRRTGAGMKFTGSHKMKAFLFDYVDKKINEDDKNVLLGYSSMAKFMCSDSAVKVCLKALEIMGNEGIEERNLAEKYLRDAKLTQIYEGTNQLNRFTVYKYLINGAVK